MSADDSSIQTTQTSTDAKRPISTTPQGEACEVSTAPPLTPEETAIPTLGEATRPTVLRAGHFVDDATRVAVYDRTTDHGFCSEPRVTFEQAGPRRTLYFEPRKIKCAIVTCGGLCPGINDVIRSIVLEAYHNYGVAAVLGIRYGLEGFVAKYKHEVEEFTTDNVAHIHDFGGTMLGSSRGPQEPSDIVDALERMNIGALFMIGGDGTMKAARAITQEVRERGLHKAVIGVPKTIDNDISYVDRSFGFDTAVEKASEAIRCAHTEAKGHPGGIGLVKLMGRQSGFIAAQAALSLKEVNFVLVPEEHFELHGENGFLAALERRLKARKHAVVVVAEGAGQHLLDATGQTDASGNIRLGDIAQLLKREIGTYLGDKGMEHTLKYIDPSYIIRSVPANVNDRIYCGFLGQNAVHAAMSGRTAMVVSRWNDRYVHVPLDLVTRERKRIEICSNYWNVVTQSTGQVKYFYPDSPAASADS